MGIEVTPNMLPSMDTYINAAADHMSIRRMHLAVQRLMLHTPASEKKDTRQKLIQAGIDKLFIDRPVK